MAIMSASASADPGAAVEKSTVLRYCFGSCPRNPRGWSDMHHHTVLKVIGALPDNGRVDLSRIALVLQCNDCGVTSYARATITLP